MTDKEKLKLVQEATDIITSNCIVLGINILELQGKYLQLAIRMFIEGVAYWEKKRKEIESN